MGLEVMFYHPVSIILLLLATFHFIMHFVSDYEMKSLTNLSIITKVRSRPADENSSLIIRLPDWHHTETRTQDCASETERMLVDCPVHRSKNFCGNIERVISHGIGLPCGPKPCSAKKSKI